MKELETLVIVSIWFFGLIYTVLNYLAPRINTNKRTGDVLLWYYWKGDRKYIKLFKL